MPLKVKKMGQFLCFGVIVVFLFLADGLFFLPWELVTEAQENGEKENSLKTLVVEVNGHPREVPRGKTLRVVWGDQIRIISAVLMDGGQVAEYVNLQGFRTPRSVTPHPENDVGDLVDTGKALMRGWSLGGAGIRYRFLAKTGTYLHGKAYLELMKPQLKYTVLRINGVRSVLHPDDSVTAKGSDTVKVEQVVTNLDGLDQGVTFRIVPLEDRAKKGKKPFEIRFFRRKYEFAKISLLLEDL